MTITVLSIRLFDYSESLSYTVTVLNVDSYLLISDIILNELSNIIFK